MNFSSGEVRPYIITLHCATLVIKRTTLLVCANHEHLAEKHVPTALIHITTNTVRYYTTTIESDEWSFLMDPTAILQLINILLGQIRTTEHLTPSKTQMSFYTAP